MVGRDSARRTAVALAFEREVVGIIGAGGRLCVLGHAPMENRNGLVVAACIEAITEDDAGQALVQQCLARLGQFFSEAVDAKLISSDSNPRFLLLASWGMCKLVAEMSSLPYAIFEPGLSLDEQRRAEGELILKLMLHGAGMDARPRSTTQSGR